MALRWQDLPEFEVPTLIDCRRHAHVWLASVGLGSILSLVLAFALINGSDRFLLTARWLLLGTLLVGTGAAAWWSDARARNVARMQGRLPTRNRAIRAWIFPLAWTALMSLTILRLPPSEPADVRVPIVTLGFIAAVWRPYALLRRIFSALSRVDEDALVFSLAVTQSIAGAALWWQLSLMWDDPLDNHRDEFDAIAGVSFAVTVALAASVALIYLVHRATDAAEHRRILTLQTREEQRHVRSLGLNPFDADVFRQLAFAKLERERWRLEHQGEVGESTGPADDARKAIHHAITAPALLRDIPPDARPPLDPVAEAGRTVQDRSLPWLPVPRPADVTSKYGLVDPDAVPVGGAGPSAHSFRTDDRHDELRDLGGGSNGSSDVEHPRLFETPTIEVPIIDTEIADAEIGDGAAGEAEIGDAETIDTEAGAAVDDGEIGDAEIDETPPPDDGAAAPEPTEEAATVEEAAAVDDDAPIRPELPPRPAPAELEHALSGLDVPAEPADADVRLPPAKILARLDAADAETRDEPPPATPVPWPPSVPNVALRVEDGVLDQLGHDDADSDAAPARLMSLEAARYGAMIALIGLVLCVDWGIFTALNLELPIRNGVISDVDVDRLERVATWTNLALAISLPLQALWTVLAARWAARADPAITPPSQLRYLVGASAALTAVGIAGVSTGSPVQGALALGAACGATTLALVLMLPTVTEITGRSFSLKAWAAGLVVTYGLHASVGGFGDVQADRAIEWIAFLGVALSLIATLTAVMAGVVSIQLEDELRSRSSIARWQADRKSRREQGDDGEESDDTTDVEDEVAT